MKPAPLVYLKHASYVMVCSLGRKPDPTGSFSIAYTENLGKAPIARFTLPPTFRLFRPLFSTFSDIHHRITDIPRLSSG
jgi:hypothetical protein